MNCAKVLYDICATAVLGTTTPGSDWFLAIAKEPQAPSKTITFYNTGGTAPSPKWLLDYPSVQVRVRGAQDGYVASRAKAQAVKDLLLGITSQNVGMSGDRLVSVTMPGDIVDMGFDDSNRPLHSLNFRLIVEPGSGTNRQSL